jgi:bacillithiol biosynthesis cysteine-adding enzyme BshC
MPIDCISYKNSGYFSKLMIDYLDQNPKLKKLYGEFPTIENFAQQIALKENTFSLASRKVLVKALEQQYTKVNVSSATLNNINLLNKTTTFTITTGHQLNLFTGPLYFLYKIVSAINLSKELKRAYPNYDFVPVYWMATEDHDFDEINYFNYKDKKITWNKMSSGPVGRLSTEGLDKVFEVFSSEIGSGNNAQYLKGLFQKAYLEHENLADATLFLANELFKEEGLIIIDADTTELKKLFIPYVQKELCEQISYKKVTEASTLLSDYAVQVHPREINLFYIGNNLRERIVFENNLFKVNNTTITFTESEVIAEVTNHPEKFSPNVILRPLYQEVILPNLCYIGGGGELAYWLQLKSNFEANNIVFPMLLLRNSVLLVSSKQASKADKLGLTWQDLFLKQTQLINQKTASFTKQTIDFSKQKAFLQEQFKELHTIASVTDPSFLGAVKAQEAKQIKGLEHLEKRLLKAEKKLYSNQLSRITNLQNELFPKQNLQERNVNFSEFYQEYGDDLLQQLYIQLFPLAQNFTVIVL